MGFIAVLVNCALIGLSGQVHRMFPEMSTTQTILLIVALEVSGYWRLQWLNFIFPHQHCIADLCFTILDILYSMGC